MEFEAVAEAVAGIPFMTPKQGRLIYDHIRETRPECVLELGTGYGVSTAYMAAALDANGTGRLISVDHVQSGLEHPPVATLRQAGLDHHIDLVRLDASSYTWWLMKRVAEQSDEAGNCEPLFDFCYLDGAHHWTIDGLAVYLVEKLLRPGGWLLLDDLDWHFADDSTTESVQLPFLPMGADERQIPHMQLVFDLIVKQHPAFGELRVQDGRWGWARKGESEKRRLTLETTQSLGSLAVTMMRRVARR
jgi:predicted O-methyltransferase YrrM